jgi:hypothetical protein
MKSGRGNYLFSLLVRDVNATTKSRRQKVEIEGKSEERVKENSKKRETRDKERWMEHAERMPKALAQIKR